MSQEKTSKILYDGDCALCKRSVRFIARHDGAGRFEFLPLQSVQGKEWLKKMGYPEDYNDSVMLIDGNDKYTSSDAVFNIMGKLNQPWSWLYCLKFIPRPVRDFFYHFISKVRHRKFVQKMLSCDKCGR